MRLTWRLSSYLLLAVGAVATTGFALMPTLTPGAYANDGALVYLAVALLGTGMSVAGIWQGPRPRRRIWIAIGVGQCLFFLGDVLWVIYAQVLQIAPYPSVADVSYLAKYVACALGLAWLIRGRRQGRDRAALLDAAIITCGFAVVASLFLIVPAAQGGGETLLSQLVAGAYPVADVLLLGMLIRLIATRSARSLAFMSLVGGSLTLLAGDLVYTVNAVSGLSLPAWSDLGYLASYILMGFCAMHPSAAQLTEPLPDRDESVTIWRVALLALSSIVAPVLLVVATAKGSTLNAYVIGLGAIVGSTLVLLRLLDLVRRAEGQAVQLAALARNDGLTGIANRRTWDHELSRACAQAASSGLPLTVALIDLDHFKLFNDTHGHLMGDLALKETTAAWVDALGDRGFLARYGGEEFAVLVPASTQTAAALLERMSRVVARGQTCSIGVASWRPDEDPGAAFARADEALYHAKRSGRNRIAFSEADVVTRIERDSSTVRSVTPVFQPIVDIVTGTALGFEALSRFDGLSAAEAFAEARQMQTTGELEIAAISAALNSWHPPGWLTLNVSLSTLVSHELDVVLPGDLTSLVFEITESELGACTPLTHAALAGLRARGARIAVDDFGVGFSNLQRILDVAPDMIKVDMSLVRDLHLKPLNQAALRALVAYAVEVGSQICAEGVERLEEWAALQQAGVQLGQGYLFGRPGPLLPQPRSGELTVRVIPKEVEAG